MHSIRKSTRRTGVVRGRDLDALVERVNWLSSLRGVNGVSVRESVRGPVVDGAAVAGIGGSGVVVYVVQSNATGGGYYNAKRATLDGEKWDQTDVDQWGSTGDSEVVCNIHERPVTGDTESHLLAAGELMLCWQMRDSEGVLRWVGTGLQRYIDCTEEEE